MERIRALWNRGLLGKVALIGAGTLGLLLICCVALLIAVPSPPRPQQGAALTTVPVVAATEATAAQPTEPPVATAAVGATIEPTTTVLVKPTATLVEPIVLPKPTETVAVPVAQPEPTAASAASGPSYHGSGNSQIVDPPWWPCEKGQIKGNRNSDIYHIPTGRSYAKTFKNVQCFDTAAEAEAAGYRAAKN